jgi:hypothetical protein
MDAGPTAGAVRRDRVRSFSLSWSKTQARAQRERFCLVIASASEQSSSVRGGWIASSRSLSSGRPFPAGPVGSSQCRAPMRRERASLHPLAAAFSHPGAPIARRCRAISVAGQFERWSGRWDSNPRPQPWQGCALPLSYTRIRKRVRRPRPQPSYAKERQAWQPLAGPRQELAGGRIRSMGTRSRRSAPAGRPCRRARDRARCGLRAG